MTLCNPVISMSLAMAAPVAPPPESTPTAASASADEAIQPMVDALDDPAPVVAWQFTIEQRVILRVPRQSNSARRALDDLRRLPPRANSYKSRKIGKCVAMNSIAGVQVSSDNKLMLYMRDRRVIRAELEKSCQARDFYSGFYLEMSEDGRLCSERDLLHSRSGAKCEIESWRELIPDDD